MYCMLFVLVAAVFTSAVTSQGDVSNDVGNICAEQTMCGSCIAANSKCSWCMQSNFSDGQHSRCDYVENLMMNQCDETYLIHPEHVTEFVKEEPPRDSTSSEDAIQLSPQEMTIELRPNKPYTFELNFRLAANYPVDLYYVMDLSFSMRDDKATLAALGRDIAIEMRNVTNNFQLGFGSFVDKKTMPYVSMVPSKLDHPCLPEETCTGPYGFINQLKLTENADDFVKKVLEAPISGNLDSPEGTFDAMMQAISCKDSIGWRDTARRMLVVSTDNDFHYAGDGKLGGIVTPNDGNCHLVNNEYSQSLNQDYPSISHLAHRIAEEKVNVIFAITSDQVPKYNRLSAMIEGSVVGELEGDSSNIVQLIRKNYEKISGKVELRKETSEGVFVNFRTKCRGNEWVDVSSCDHLGVGQNVTFEVTIEVTECPEDETQLDKIVNIYPVGLAEQLKIRLKLICECDCESDMFPGLGDVKPPKDNSPHCNNSGTYMCGACECNEGRYGKDCQCDGSTATSDDYEASCRQTNTSAVCSDRGHCECGECVCNPLHHSEPTKTFSGKYCECNNYGCDFFNGQLCGGPERGVCKCGKCMCTPSYTGTNCNCPKSKETCMSKEGLICNGKGECKCGRCECTLDQFFRGPTCEDCPSCPGQCDINKACVQCTMFQTGPYSPEYCTENCTHIKKVPEVEKDHMDDRRLCKFRDDDDCDFYFTYFYDNDMVEAQEEKECPEPLNVLAIVFGVIGGIIAIGLALLLIWKLLVTIHDRREFAKFEKERQNAKWEAGENPIFKPSTSTFQNPTYGNK